MKKVLLLLAVAAMLLPSCNWSSTPAKEDDTSEFRPGSGVVAYTGYAPLKDKPVNIHYYIPAKGDVTTMPILFVFPGVNRNANDYLKAWISDADYRKFIVLALEFPLEQYSSSQYIEGGIFSGSTLNPEEKWTFSIIEPMFDYIKLKLGSTQTTYNLWGHSAGAQFVHRMVIFKSNLRLRRAVASNPGWYTVPDQTVAYPYGLKGSPAASSDALTRMMAADMVIHLGTADTDPNDSALNTTPGAMAQGPYRYARGLFFFSESQRIATQNGITLKWTKREAPGVAHEFDKMAADAAGFLF